MHEVHATVAPYLRQFGNLSIQENLAVTWPYACALFGGGTK